MKLTNTAGLAALVLVFPLAATAVYGSGNYDVHYNDTPDASGKVASSGYKETVTGEHFDIYIGHASGSGEKVKALESSNNVGILCAGSEGYRIYGGYAETAGDADVEACFNKITVEEGSEGGSATTAGWARVHNNAFSSQGSATASGNECYITNQASSLNYGSFRGGVSIADTGDSYANDNIVKAELNENVKLFTGISSGESLSYNANAYACGNNLQVKGGGKVVGEEWNLFRLLGGSAQAGYGAENSTVKANDNTMEVADLVFTIEDLGYIKIIGGEADNDSASGTCLAEANGNTYILNGGTYSGTIYAGYASLTNADSGTAEASNNRVELRNGSSGAPDLTNASICVAKASANNANVTLKSTGNSLNFYDVKGMTAKSISGFQSLNYEYSEMVAGDVILTVTGTDDEKTTSIAKTDVSVSVVNLYGKNSGEFKIGDKVVLLKNDNGIDTTGIETKATITAETGISLTYEVEIQTNDEGTELILTRTATKDSGDKDDTTVLPGTKAIAEGAAAGLALVNESANASMEFLRDFSLISGSITPFVHVQASSARHETGSSINVSAVSLMAGLGTGIETGAGNLSLGAFFEYGKGSYTTHNSFSDYNDVDGDGNSWYMGGGILAKMEFLQTGPGHFYLEGSAHMGTLHNEYDSNDLYDANGNVAKFDMDSPYYSLHGGLGYVWNMTEGHDLDVYGKYIWTRVQGTDDTLTTKDKFEYDDMDSNRVRFGVRYTYNGSERFKPYVGAAFEHEFSGTCESTAYGHPVAAPSFEGSSGMGELGLMMKPSEDLPLSINLGVQGYVGQKQGVSGNCNIMYEF